MDRGYTKLARTLDETSTVSHRFAEQSSAPSTPASGFLQAYGDTSGRLHSLTDGGVDYDLTGLAFPTATELTISSGAVTRTQLVHTIDTESDAATDDLDTINGAGSADNFLLISSADDARTVVVKHGTGNIVTGDGNDVPLDDSNKTLVLYYDGTNWRVAAGSAITSFTVAGDSGGGQAITDGNTLTIAGGSGITTTDSATDTVTVAIDSTVMTGSTGATDNAVLRADGTGGSTLQSSGVTINDSNNVDIPGALQVDGDLSVGDGVGPSLVDMDGAAGANRRHRFFSGGSIRWQFGVNSEAESGADAGSNFDFTNYDDSGTIIGTAIRVDRASGDSRFFNDVNIDGALSKGSGTFKIDHPLSGLGDTHHLRYEMTEGPRAYLTYSSTTAITAQTQTVDLAAEFNLTPGTIEALHRADAVQVHVSAPNSWSRVRGNVSGGTLTIETHPDDALPDAVDWLIFAERGDEHMTRMTYTDATGRVVNEQPKPIN